MKKILCFATACALSPGCLCIPASAVEIQPPQRVVARAVEHFDTTVSANAAKNMDSDLYMEAGEIVTINATYSPSSANVDFGLLDSDGIFHYITEEDGNAYVEIEIEHRDKYQFAIRNNSSNTITVSGFVEY